jgi:type I restriction enzyme S subunit
MKQGWEIKKFEDCLEKVVYTTKIQKKDFLEIGDYPIISQEKDFINGYWNDSNDLFKVKKPIVIFGDHTQVLKYVDFDFVLGADGVKILQPTNSIDPRFFYYFLQNINLGSLGYARHYRLLKVIEVPYPKSLSEQQRIVVILDEAFAAIAKAKANAEQNLKNAKELFESYLQGVFEKKGDNWESNELMEVCEQITDGSHFSPKSSGEDEYPYITVRDIDEDIIDFDNCKFICENDYQSLLKNGCKPNSGDLLFSKDGTVGKVSLVDFEKDFVVLSSLAIIRPKSKIIISPLLKYILKDPLFLQTAIGMKTGVAIRRIILKNLKLIEISFPKSLKEQQAIVQKLDALSSETKKLEAIYQQKINDLEELKKSVLQKAFSGELKTSKALV